jgi:hypothetical protein
MYTLEDGSKVAGIPPKYSGWVMNKFGRIEGYHTGKWYRVGGHALEEAKELWINDNRINKAGKIVLLCLH